MLRNTLVDWRKRYPLLYVAARVARVTLISELDGIVMNTAATGNDHQRMFEKLGNTNGCVISKQG